MKRLFYISVAVMLFLRLFVINSTAMVPENPMLNFITNGNFETQADIDKVGKWSTETEFTLATGQGVDGSNCLEVSSSSKVVDGISKGDARIYAEALKSAMAGEKYHISAKIRMKTQGATATVRWATGYKDNSQFYLTTSNSPFNGSTGDITVTDQWTLLSDTITVPSDYTKTEIPFFMLRFKTEERGAYYLDDFQIVKLSHRNHVLNPNFNEGTLNWEVRNASTAGAATIVPQSTGGVDNSPCLRIDKTTYLGDIRQYVSLQEGATYYISAKIRLESGKTSNAGLLHYYNGTGQWITNNQSANSKEWTTISGVYTVPVNGNKNSELSIRASGADVGAAYIDDVCIFKLDENKSPYEVTYEGLATKAGTLKANIDFYNTLSTSMDCPTVILALYDGEDRLVDVEMQKIVETDAYSASQTSVSLSVPKDDDDAYAKLFVWESMDAMKPFTELKEKSKYTIGFIGGSLTEGGATWIAAVKDYFEEIYPDKNIVTVQSGIGGTGSVFCAARYEKDILSTAPDLVFIDTTVNDSRANEIDAKVYMESMIRQSLNAEKIPAIIFLHTPQPVDKTHEFYGMWENVRDWKNEVAEYYGLNSIDIYDYMYKDYEENKDVNGWDSYIDYMADNGYTTWVEEGVRYDVHAGYVKYGEAIVDALDKNFKSLVKKPSYKQTKYLDDARVDWNYRFSYPDSMTYDNNWTLYKTAYTNPANSSHNISSGLLLKHPGGILQTTTKDSTVTYTSSKDALGFNVYYISSTQGATVSVSVDGVQKNAAACTYNAADSGYNASGWIALPNDDKTHTITITTSGIDETTTVFRMGCIVECYG